MRGTRILLTTLTAVVAVVAPVTLPPGALASVTCSGVNVASGASIQRAIDSHPQGTTFCLSGSYNTSTAISPKNGDRFVGVGTTNVASGGAAVFAGGKNVAYVHLGIGPSKGDGVRPGDGSKIRRSTIHDNPDCGISTAGNSLVIRNNEIRNNGTTTVNTSRACGVKIRGMTGSDSGAYSIVTGNLIHDNGHNAMWADCNAHDNVFSNNRVYDNTGIAIDAETSYRNTFSGNAVYRNGAGQTRPAVSILDSIGTVVRDNTFAHNYAGVLIWADRRAKLSAARVGSGCADASLTGYIPSNNSIGNNRFATEQRVGFWLKNVRLSAASFDGNCYTVARLADLNWQLPADQTASWKQWRAAGNDPNGIHKTASC
jgi:parallel beta-helix repeat protein